MSHYEINVITQSGEITRLINFSLWEDVIEYIETNKKVNCEYFIEEWQEDNEYYISFVRRYDTQGGVINPTEPFISTKLKSDAVYLYIEKSELKRMISYNTEV